MKLERIDTLPSWTEGMPTYSDFPDFAAVVDDLCHIAELREVKGSFRGDASEFERAVSEASSDCDEGLVLVLVDGDLQLDGTLGLETCVGVRGSLQADALYTGAYNWVFVGGVVETDYLSLRSDGSPLVSRGLQSRRTPIPMLQGAPIHELGPDASFIDLRAARQLIEGRDATIAALLDLLLFDREPFDRPLGEIRALVEANDYPGLEAANASPILPTMRPAVAMEIVAALEGGFLDDHDKDALRKRLTRGSW